MGHLILGHGDHTWPSGLAIRGIGYVLMELGAELHGISVILNSVLASSGGRNR